MCACKFVLKLPMFVYTAGSHTEGLIMEADLVEKENEHVCVLSTLDKCVLESQSFIALVFPIYSL